MQTTQDLAIPPVMMAELQLAITETQNQTVQASNTAIEESLKTMSTIQDAFKALVEENARLQEKVTALEEQTQHTHVQNEKQSTALLDLQSALQTQVSEIAKEQLNQAKVIDKLATSVNDLNKKLDELTKKYDSHVHYWYKPQLNDGSLRVTGGNYVTTCWPTTGPNRAEIYRI